MAESHLGSLMGKIIVGPRESDIAKIPMYTRNLGIAERP